MLAPTAQLRVFLPLDAYPPRERRHWEAYVAAGRGLTRLEAEEQRRRLAQALAVNRQPPATDGALIRRVGRRHLVCPLDLDLRSGLTFRRLREALPERVVLSLVPDERTRARLERLGHGGRTSQIRESAWAVPLVWYLAFEPSEQHRREPAEGRRPSVRLVTSVGQARERLERVFDLTAGLIDLEIEAGAADIDDLLTWLSAFPDEGVVELDYGDLALDMPGPRDHACRDLWRAVAALEAGDVFEATVAYGVAQSCWSDLRDRATTC